MSDRSRVAARLAPCMLHDYVARCGAAPPEIAPLLADDCWPLVVRCCTMLRFDLDHWPRDVDADGTRWRRACRGRVRPCSAREFMVAAAGRPSRRRSSGDVVTADFF
ncbi:hypothetical protein F511_47396 [Dorcoceras hygrometricum]|uniref:Uncharacterized protein n=1 Tax=Dorcoceras hygrometricum TaxID=472368 RepID=A0A2Z6ZRQ2_9LAMI|nr:hypothetical protein F511_47396 [Dorcoceras hygrometricum]